MSSLCSHGSIPIASIFISRVMLDGFWKVSIVFFEGCMIYFQSDFASFSLLISHERRLWSHIIPPMETRDLSRETHLHLRRHKRFQGSSARWRYIACHNKSPPQLWPALHRWSCFQPFFIGKTRKSKLKSHPSINSFCVYVNWLRNLMTTARNNKIYDWSRNRSIYVFRKSHFLHLERTSRTTNVIGFDRKELRKQ